MGRFARGKRLGVRDWVTMKVIAVYPYEARDSDEETEKAVLDWFYELDCTAEDQMGASFVDMLSDEEAATLPDGLVEPDEPDKPDDSMGGRSGGDPAQGGIGTPS